MLSTNMAKISVSKATSFVVAAAISSSLMVPAANAAPASGPTGEQQAQAQVVTPDVTTLGVLGKAASSGGELEASQATVEEATDRMVVKFKEGVSEEQKQEVLNAAASATALEDPEKVRETATQKDVVESADMMDKGEQQVVKEVLEASPVVESAEPDLIVKNATAGFTSSPNDPLYSTRQWNLSNMNVQQAWAQTSGKGVTIGIADTGDTWHPDLNPNKVVGYDFVSPGYDRDSNYGRDANSIDPGVLTTAANWHGTHVAGLAAAAGNNGQGMVGVAPEAKISSARVMGTGASGYVSDFADGITWLSGGTVPGVPRNPNPSQVVNFSAAWPSAVCPSDLKAAIDGAHARNVPVVVAAGNTAADTRFQSPANCLGAIVVGATTSWNAMTSYSNWGVMIDVVAPGGTVGSDIWSTWNTGFNAPANATYGPMNGTSMAAPQVAGVVALMKEKNPNMTVEQIRSTLVNTGTPLAGYRKVNAGAAVNATPGAATPPPAPAPAQPTYTTVGAINNYYQQNKSILGAPTMNEQGGLVNGGVYQIFSNNRTVYWTEWSGTHAVYTGGDIGNKFRQNGHENGWGYPVTDEAATGDGGAYQVFRKANGLTTRVVWHPATGSQAVPLYTGIGAAWAANGGEKGVGYPLGGEKANGHGGFYQVFRKADGTINHIIWSPQTGGHVIREGTAIYNSWRYNGSESGNAGYPTMNEQPLNDGYGGTYQKFRTADGGERTIYWTEATGARMINDHGAIADLWRREGGLNGLGYPIFDETPHPGGTVSQEFKNLKTGKVTVVTWHPHYGAFKIQRTSVIGSVWISKGGSRSEWGVPISNEYPSNNGRIYQKFSNNTLVYWQRGVGVVVMKTQ